MPFAYSLRRAPLLFILLFASFCSQLRAQVNPPSLSRPTHMWWQSSAGFENLPVAPSLGAQGDFDEDGLEDVLVGDLSDIYVAHNTPWGLEPWVSMPLERGGIKNLFWDETENALWVQRTSPDKVEVRRWKNNQFTLEHAFPGSPETLNLNPGTGMVSLKRKGLELELLRADGTAEVLVKDASELTNAWLWQDDKSEAQALVLQDKSEGKLGLAQSTFRGWESPEWWEDTPLTSHWFVDVSQEQDGAVHLNIVGADHQSFWHKSVETGSGKVVRNWRSSDQLGELRILALRHLDSSIELIAHNPMTYVVRAVKLNAQSGSLEELVNFEELAQVPFVLDLDLRGDGTREWMYPVSEKASWSVVNNWANVSQRWFWRNLENPVEESDFGKLGQVWMQGLGNLEGVREVWMHRGKLHAQTSESWWTIERTEQPTSKPAQDPVALNETPHSLQLVVPYLELGDRGTGSFMPGIAEIKPHVWHHLAFSRDEDNDTRVWLDGTLVFLGKSKDLNYLYNSLIVGANFGSQWGNHGAVSVDRAVLSGSLWSDEDVKSMSRGEDNLGPGQVAERWEFDDPSFESERRKRAMLLHSEPRLDEGLHGGCVTLDGQDDALRTFLAVPKKGISIGFFFRLNQEAITRPNTIATLYGMYNTWFNVVWQPTSFLAQPDATRGVITTPKGHRILPSEWPTKCTPFVHEGTLFLLDSNNVILEEGPLGWQSAVAPPREMVGRTGHPWISNKHVHLVDAQQTLWTWSTEESWRCEGRIHGSESVIPVAAEEGMLAPLDSSWTVWRNPMLSGNNLDVSMGQVAGILTSPAGEVLQLTTGQTISFSPFRGLPGTETPPLVSTSNVNRRSMLLSCLVLGAIVLALVRLRKQTGLSGLQKADTPQDLRIPLEAWAALGGAPVDAQELDALLSDASHESEETRRGRRSRFIREMNAWGQLTVQEDFVLRERDSHDRRRAVYVLHPRVIEIFEDEQIG